MDIKRFSANDESSWDALIPGMNNGTLFHSRKFLSYHPGGRFVDHSLLFLKNNRIRAVFPAAEVRAEDGTKLVSHPGASFGSFVVPEDLTFRESKDMVQKLIDYCCDHGFSGIQITMPPVLYSRRPSNYMDFSLLQAGFHYRAREITSVLFLEKDINKTVAKFKASHRQAVRRAERRGVTARQSHDLDAFYAILKQNLKIRHNVQPTHSPGELKRLKKLFPDDIQLWGAYIDNKMVAGVVNFICNTDAILAFYISHDEAYQDYRPLNLLFYTIFEWAIEKHFRVFDFGIFTVKEKPNYGLGRFKENFGASGMFRDTLEKTL